jgi:hypothetical protein
VNPKMKVMSKIIRTGGIIFMFFLILSLTDCAPASKNTYYQKKKKSTMLNNTQLGRNRYYFSKDYQKKLYKSYKKKRNSF